MNGSKCGNGGELVRLADEDQGQKGKGGGVAAAYVQPEPGPVIEEELGSSSSGGRGKGEVAEKASGGMEVAGRQGRGDGSDGTAKGGGDKRKKRRGKRQRGTNFSEIITINSSGFPQLRQLLEARGRTEGSVVVLAQEHHRKEAQVLDVQAVARKNGWKGTIVPAVAGEGGGSAAGVAIFTAAHVPCGLQVGTTYDISPKVAQGRAVALWVQQVVPCGVLVISVYLYTGEGPTPRNRAIMGQALMAARSSGSPWVIGGDFQDAPQDIFEWAQDMVEKAGGKVVSTVEPTIYPSVGRPRTIDFFVVSAELAALVQKVEVLERVAVSPHRAVAITFRNTAEPLLQWQLRTPKKFPKNKPIGCARQPIAPEEDYILEAKAKGSLSKGKGLSDLWSDLVWAAEAELCGVTDKYTKEGPDQRWCGRALGARYAKGVVMPDRAAGAYGKLDKSTHALLWAANRLQELAALAAIARDAVARGEGGWGLSGPQWTQWNRVINKIASPSAPICPSVLGDQRWGGVMEKVQAGRLRPAQGHGFLISTANWATALLKRKVKERGMSRRMGWKAWINEQAKGGGSGLHRFVKRTVEKPEQLLFVKGGATAAPQDIADSDLREWEIIWKKHEGRARSPWREWQSGVGEIGTMPLRARELRVAAAQFKKTTGVGVDAISPRAYGWLSDELLDAIGRFLGTLEEEGVWPQQLEEALIHLIPKAAGGRRPIGLLASLPRLWARARKERIREWRTELGREYDWMRRGRGSEKAVWVQSVMEEAARQRGLAFAAVLVDLVKAFEQVMLHLVWEAGVEHNFPLEILRLSLEACTFKRRLVYRGAVSERAVDTWSAIMAGHGFGTDFMLLALMGPLDELIKQHTSLKVFVVADDAKFGLVGEEGAVAQRLGRVTAECIHMLEGRQGMQVSRDTGDSVGKTVAIASTKKLRAQVGQRVGRLGVRVMRSAKNLGVDYVVGAKARRRGNTVAKERWRAVHRVKERVRRLGTRAAACVTNTGLIPSVKYGANITGVSDGALGAWRKLAASMYGSTRGRSITARLAMEQADLAQGVVKQAIMAWVNAWWDGDMGQEDMEAAWRYAIRTVGMSTRPNQAVEGGAGAYFAALRRVGWQAPSVHTVRTRDGSVLYFGEGRAPCATLQVDPRTIGRWVEDDFEIAVGLASQVARDITDVAGIRGYGRADEDGRRAHDGARRMFGVSEHEKKCARVWRHTHLHTEEEVLVPWFWPMAKVVRAAYRSGSRAAAASVRACIEGGWWVQRRLYSQSMAGSDVCKCGEAAGTLWHKLGVCRLSQEEREAFNKPEIFKWGRRAVFDPLFSRGVPARPKLPRTPSPCSWKVEEVKGGGLWATGDVYTDGSAEGGFFRAIRAGWGAVALSEDGVVSWRAGGVCHEPQANIFRAELSAVLAVLQMALPPLRIHVDNAQVVQGFRMGRPWCVRSRSYGADLWREVWDKYEDVGGGIEVVKVKAHTSWWEVLAGRISARDRAGNDLADKEAKKALKEAIKSSPIAAFNGHLARAVEWAKWMLRYAESWKDDTTVGQEQADELERHNEEEAGGGGKGRATMTHEKWEVGGEVACRRCGRRERKTGGGGNLWTTRAWAARRVGRWRTPRETKTMFGRSSGIQKQNTSVRVRR